MAGSHRRRGPLGPAEKIQNTINRSAGVTASKFPSDLQAHSLLMNFVEYSYNGDSASSATTLSVALPIPGQGVVDKAALEYNAQELGTIAASAVSGVTAAREKFEQAGDESTGSSEEPSGLDMATLMKDTLTFAGAVARENVPTQSAKNALDLASGTTVNPHIALLFQAVGLKQFSFNWKLAPQTQAESESLKSIIKSMQKAIHPTYVTAENNFFLKYPNQVDLYYQGTGDYLHKFKRAAVTSFEVNYQPEGGNLFFAGTGAPAVVDLSMGFQEVEIWTSEDYE